MPLGTTGQRGGQLLTNENVKSIFGNIPDILKVHINIMVSGCGRWAWSVIVWLYRMDWRKGLITGRLIHV